MPGRAFLAGDPTWLTDDARRLIRSVPDLWPALLVITAAPVDIRRSPGFGRSDRPERVVALAALLAHRLLPVGPGVEEALLVTASLGAAMTAAAALDSFSRNALRLVATGGAIAIAVVSVLALGNGRLGLPAGDVNSRLSFATTLADEPDPGRLLHISVDRELIPGEVRSGPGFWYRLLDGAGTTSDEVWLPAPLPGDEALGDALDEIASGAELRPGDRLAPYAVDWVVIEGPETVLDEVLIAQLDLVPVPLDPEARVYENRSAAPIAGSIAVPWQRRGLDFVGESVSGPVALSVNYDEGWAPDPAQSEWLVTIDGSDGLASYRPTGLHLPLSSADDRCDDHGFGGNRLGEAGEMRYVVLAAVFVLGLATVLAPISPDPAPGEVPGREPPPLSICPLLEGGGQTTDVAVLSSINGVGRLSTFSAGVETGSLDFRTGATGSVIVPASEAGAVGDSAGLIELPSDTTAAGVVISGAFVARCRVVCRHLDSPGVHRRWLHRQRSSLRASDPQPLCRGGRRRPHRRHGGRARIRHTFRRRHHPGSEHRDPGPHRDDPGSGNHFDPHGDVAGLSPGGGTADDRG